MTLQGIARRAGLGLLALAGTVGLVVLLFATSVHLYAGDSDKATALLEGQAVLHGHVLLHGWFLPLDPFWTVDAPVFAAGVLVAGVRPSLLALEPAIMATAVVVVGVLMARTAAVAGRARTAAIVAGGATVVAVLGLPNIGLATFYVQNGFHIGTALWALLAFAALARRRFGWAWALGVAALAVGLLGDLELLVYGVAPVALAGLAAMARRRSWRAGITLVAGAGAACAVAEGARRVVIALGGFTTGPPLPLAHLAQVWRNLGNVVTFGGYLLGATHGLGTGRAPIWLYRTHALAALVVVASLAFAIYRLLAGAVTGDLRATVASGGAGPGSAGAHGREQDGGDAGTRGDGGAVLDDLLLLATLGVTASFVGSALSSDVGFARYLDAAVIFAAILAGRYVARFVQWSAGWQPAPALRALRRGAAVLGIGVVMACAACSGFLLTRPVPGSAPRTLAAWLARHGLHDGIGDYWVASITTVESGGAVEVRPVTAEHNQGRLGRMLDQSAAAWYGGQQFQFLVYSTNPVWEGVDAASAAATFGPPAHTYDVAGYHVLTWTHDLTVPASGVYPHP